jgi:hypothetical protein
MSKSTDTSSLLYLRVRGGKKMYLFLVRNFGHGVSLGSSWQRSAGSHKVRPGTRVDLKEDDGHEEEKEKEKEKEQEGREESSDHLYSSFFRSPYIQCHHHHRHSHQPKRKKRKGIYKAITRQKKKKKGRKEKKRMVCIAKRNSRITLHHSHHFFISSHHTPHNP